MDCDGGQVDVCEGGWWKVCMGVRGWGVGGGEAVWNHYIFVGKLFRMSVC